MELKSKFTILCFLILFSWIQDSFAQETGGTAIHLADPTVFFHEETYYLYGTVEGNADQGFLVYSSPDLKEWEGPVGANQGFALKKADVFGDKGFWAPQVFFHKDKFYMAYTANENIAIAESDSPLGPFTQPTIKPLEAPVKQIDPFVFIDGDGKPYLYHVRLTEGNRLFVAEMTEDLSAILPETLKECINASDPWENTQQVPWPVAEGPSILTKDGLYYLVYSANDFRNPDYAVGYAVSEHPMGPWKKYTDNPVLDRNGLMINGTGHGDFFKDEEGQLMYVFHTHHSGDSVAPRKTALVKAGFSKDDATSGNKLIFDTDTFYYPEL